MRWWICANEICGLNASAKEFYGILLINCICSSTFLSTANSRSFRMFLVRCYHRSLYAPKNCEWNQGLRSVDHCVECLCSLSGNPYSDGLASAALTLLVRGLRGVKKNPTDQDARTDCQLGIFQARGIWINVRFHNLHVFTIYLYLFTAMHSTFAQHICTAHLHSTFAQHICTAHLHSTSGPNHPYPSGSSGMSKWSPNGSFTCHWPHPGSCLWRPSRLHLLCRFACCAAVERRGLKLWSVVCPELKLLGQVCQWLGYPVPWRQF